MSLKRATAGLLFCSATACGSDPHPELHQAGASGSGGDGSGGTGTGAATGSGGSGGTAGKSGSNAIVSGPRYLGTVNNAAGCNREYMTSGFEPATRTGTRHPLFLYFTGTNFTADEATFRQQAAPAARAVTEAMARRGFVALWAEYDNGGAAWASDHVQQLACLFTSNAPTASLLDVACAWPKVDCTLGIAIWGHSQGALIAHVASNYNPQVRAVWLTGYGGDTRATLAKNRLRVVNGEGELLNAGTVPVLNQIAGFDSTECANDGRTECLRSDGSGWIIVRKNDLADPAASSADHCWFEKRACLDAATAPEPNWVDPASTKPFALEKNADWVAEAARR